MLGWYENYKIIGVTVLWTRRVWECVAARYAAGRCVAVKVVFVVPTAMDFFAHLLLTVCVVEKILFVRRVKFVVLGMGWFQVAEMMWKIARTYPRTEDREYLS